MGLAFSATDFEASLGLLWVLCSEGLAPWSGSHFGGVLVPARAAQRLGQGRKCFGGTSWSGSSGESQGGAHSVSQVDGQWQKWCLPLAPSPEQVPPDPCPSSACLKIHQWVSFSCDPSTFQAAASVLGVRVSECVCKPFRSVSVSHSPSALLNVNLTGLQSQALWELVFPVQIPPGWGAWCGACSPCSSGGISVAVTPLLCVGCCTGGVGWTRLCLCHSCLSHCVLYFLFLV